MAIPYYKLPKYEIEALDILDALRESLDALDSDGGDVKLKMAADYLLHNRLYDYQPTTGDDNANWKK